MKKKSKKRWLWLILMAVILAGAFVVYNITRISSLRAQAAVYSTYTVKTGSIEVGVTGGGKLVPAQTLSVELPVGIKVDKVLVQAGDVVKAGDKVALLDSDSIRNQATVLSDELAALDSQLNALEDKKTVEYVAAPVKGRIKYLGAQAEDEVTEAIAKNGALALISTDGKMKIAIKAEAELKRYDKVTVKWKDGEKEGQIAAQTSDGYVVTMGDWGPPYNEPASVYSGDALIGEGTIKINQPIAVYGSGGTIQKVYYSSNTKVEAGDNLFALDHEPLTGTYQKTYSDRQAKAAELTSVLGLIEKPWLTPGTDGTVSEVLVSDGEGTSSAGASASTGSEPATAIASGSAASGIKSGAGAGASAAAGTVSQTASAASSNTQVSSGAGTTKAFVIDQAGQLKMTIAVDELDIGSITLGQTAKLTLDAMTKENFGAKVTRISYLEAANGNITTYDVELTLEANPKFLAGMNGNATITVNRADNALLIPVEAINEDAGGSFVFVSATGAADGADRTRRDITTGLSDGTYAEATRGLAAGDVILYTKNSTSQTAPQTGFQGPAGLGGGGFNRSNNGTGGTGNGN